MLGAVAFSVAYFVLYDLLNPDARLWRSPAHWPSRSLLWLAVALMAVGVVRSSLGAPSSFVGPVDFLTRADRTWVRSQIAENRPVVAERSAVVADAARRMVVEGRRLPLYLGYVVLFVGLTVPAANPSAVIAFSGVVAWMLVLTVLGAVWSRRGRRWLTQHS